MGKKKDRRKGAKAWRKPGRLIAAIASSPLAREIVASALVVAAAALTRDARIKSGAKEGARKLGRAMSDAAQAAELGSGAVAAALPPGGGSGNGAKKPKRSRPKTAAAQR